MLFDLFLPIPANGQFPSCIKQKKSRDYWTALDQEIREYAAREGMLYIRDDDRHRAPFGEPPVVCNYFYHEEVRKSAKREKQLIS